MAWTENEVIYLKKNYKSKTLKELAHDLNKNSYSIKKYAEILGLSKSQKWTEQEIKFVNDNHHKIPIPEIAFILGRTPEAVYSKMYSLSDKNKKRIKRVDKKMKTKSDLIDWLNRTGIELTKKEAISKICRISKFDKELVSKEYDKWRTEYMKTKYI